MTEEVKTQQKREKNEMNERGFSDPSCAENPYNLKCRNYGGGYTKQNKYNRKKYRKTRKIKSRRR